MRLVYVDEAGIGDAKQEPFLVVAGVVVHADKQLVAVERHLDKLVERHVPKELQDGFVFHASEIFNGGKTIRRDDPYWTPERRFAIADDLAGIPRRFRLPLTFGFVERAKFPTVAPFPESYSEFDKLRMTHLAAFMSCALQVDHYMRLYADSNEVCLMVVEDNQQTKSLIAEQQRRHQEKSLALTLDEDARKHFPFRRIKEDPLFQPKRPSSAMQMADFCAYIFKRILMNGNDPRYRRFYEPMLEQLPDLSSAR